MARRRAGMIAIGAVVALVAATSAVSASAAPQPQVRSGFVDGFPGTPAPLPAQPFDWKQRALDYDAFVYDWTQPGQYPTILQDTTHYNMTSNTYKMPAYYGDKRVENADGGQEALGQIASVVGATLVGVDKSSQGGRNYVDMLRTFYKPGIGVALNTPNDVDGGQNGGQSWWYTATANVLYFMLGDQYPNGAQMSTILRSIADKYYSAAVAVGGANANFSGQGFNFGTMSLNTGSRNEGGDGAIGAAAIMMWAYSEFGDAKYLQGAKWSMDYLERTNANLYYEILPNLGPYIAARLNAEYGTSYDVTRQFEQLFAGSAVRGGWGTVEGSWNGYQVAGLQGSRTDGGGYAFAMNSFSTALFAATAKYDPAYANLVGRWMLNIDNAARFFYADQMPADKQYYGTQYIQDPAHVIAYEGLRYSEAGQSPRATGDPARFWQDWGLDPRTTDLGLYGGSWVGFLGATIRHTNVAGVNRIDLNALDFYGANSYPTYLYYNPGGTVANVQLSLPAASDLYDAESDQVLARNVTGTASIGIPAGGSRVVVVAPANATYTSVGGKTLANGTVVGYRTGSPDLAAGKTVTASSSAMGNVPSFIADGLASTRWESQTADPQWITVDLGRSSVVSRAVIDWETASAKSFDVQVSTDNSSWSTVYSTTSGPGGSQSISFAPTTARYVRLNLTQRNTQWAYSIWRLGVYQDDLALGRPMTSSSTAMGNLASFAADGVPGTRWESQTADPQWISVDLGKTTTVSRAVIDWETASAKSFAVQVSTDNSSWSTVYSTTSGPGGLQNIPFTPVQARWVRLSLTERNTQWAYSIWSFGVYQDDLALGRSVTVSSTQGWNIAQNLTDGAAGTRWESQPSDPQSVVVDLGQNRTVARTIVRWETASAKSFEVQLSTDNQQWSTVYSTSNGPGGVQPITFAPTTARYIRIVMSQRNTQYAYSIYELEAFAT